MDTRIWRQFDPVLLVTCALLVLFGIAMLYAATLSTADTNAAIAQTVRQAGFAVFGLGILVVVALIDYRFYQTMFWPLLVANIALLATVLVIGRAIQGAQRWISFGLFDIQPSEIGKLLVILTLAKYLADRDANIQKFGWFLGSLPFALIPALLVYPQPDLGTAMVYAAIWFGMVVGAGARFRHLTVLVVLAVATVPFTWRFLRGYMVQRLATFLDPSADPTGAAYNVIQAGISIGSGGWLGQGFTRGSQSGLNFLRVQSTDFIFSVLAEKLGFVGCVLLFLLFVLMLFRALHIAYIAGDSFGRSVAIGIIWMLLFQIVVNIGMNLRLVPVTGIPLPFISYGRSSLLTVLVAIGILESVRMHHRKLRF
jgi:rod shape determining protein RodA